MINKSTIFKTNFSNLLIAQTFQLFEIFNSRRHQQQINFQNLIRRARIRKKRIERINRNRISEINPQQNAGQTISFVDDPFEGNINPGTPKVARLYMKATESIGDEDKFDLTIENSQKFLDQMTWDTNTFGWGIMTGQDEVKNILKDHKDISETDIKRQTYKTWANYQATFQDPVPDGY